jgi:hypothetical protein
LVTAAASFFISSSLLRLFFFNIPSSHTSSILFAP